jgi:hypothetical protein
MAIPQVISSQLNTGYLVKKMRILVDHIEGGFIEAMITDTRDYDLIAIL